MANFFDFLAKNLKTFNFFSDTLDILLVTLIVFLIIKFVKETQAAPLMKGIILMLVLWAVADLASFNVTSFIIKSLLEFGVLAIIIIFQPEIRSILERFGRTKFNFKTVFNVKESREDVMRNCEDVIVSSCLAMSKTKTGALIVIEGDTKLGEIVNSGTVVDAAMSDEMVQNIFYPKAPLHDGAAIIRDGRVLAAGCVLPLTKNKNLPSELGTRHRASVGMSEVADCLVVVVSEETGGISAAQDGVLTRNLTEKQLRDLLGVHLHLEQEKSMTDKAKELLRGKEKKDE